MLENVFYQYNSHKKSCCDLKHSKISYSSCYFVLQGSAECYLCMDGESNSTHGPIESLASTPSATGGPVYVKQGIVITLYYFEILIRKLKYRIF